MSEILWNDVDDDDDDDDSPQVVDVDRDAVIAGDVALVVKVLVQVSRRPLKKFSPA